ncbi:DMT family transporter [Gelidibacter maritimus]|uniref:DMT family transporter n=1 Tax=Gelidibacter maritimus TaxID=2761487 RepID=A0A7W2M3N2_9FLAO|nr:DMT family transporter [Gelidibacter maritimus]MBA6152105.1 DMT family transporter [Gelidibacter maritimus]
MKVKTYAFIAAFIVQLMYGLNYTFAKDVMAGGFVKPFAFIVLRVGGATLLFWLFSFMGPKEKIDKKDYIHFFIAALFGIAINMLMFFKGLEHTTPIHASVISTTSPILVLILSAIFLNEKLTSMKILGVFIGFAGAIILTVYGKSLRSEDNVLLGNTLIFINATSFAIYLILVKKLTAKYHPLTFLKWLFLFSFFMVVPFGYSELMEIDFPSFSPYVFFAVAFVIIGATYIANLLNPLALVHLRASTVSIFIYIQPVIAGIFAIMMGSDNLTLVKVVASALIFLGIYLVTKRPKVST